MAGLDPVGFEPTKNGERRIIRGPQGRVSSFAKLDRRDVAYLHWLLEQRKQRGEA